ncbi:MAG: hypothetical protein JXR73_04250 [Candidatus Omnitrophica bacterium]|nr:hypothetical protein [Candidatus Omnitrophota bacterium]
MNFTDRLNQWGEWWASFMVYQTLDSMVILLVLGIVCFLLRKKMPAQFGYCLFLLALIKLVVPGQFSMMGYLYAPPSERAIEISYFQPISEQEITVPDGSASDGMKTPQAQKETIPSAQRPWISGNLTTPTIIMIVWGWIVIGLLSGFVWRLCKTHRLIQAMAPVQRRDLPFDIIQLKERAGVRRSVPVLTGAWITSPVVWGLFKPVLLIPNDVMKRFSANQLEWICLHEFAHIRRYDNAVLLLQKIIQILFFFHPGVWLLNWLIDQQREYACDDIALKGVNTPRIDCGEGFLGVVLNANGMPTLAMASSGMINSKTQIKKRLMRILDQERPLHTRLSLLFRLLIIAFILVVLPYGGKASVQCIRAWTEIQIDDVQRPPARYWPGMCYDSWRDVVVLHGGRNKENEHNQVESCNDTWEFDGEAWRLVSTAGPSRTGIQMVFDESRGVSLFYGGYNLKCEDGRSRWTGNSDTWQWDGKDWKLVCESNLEPGQEHGLIYDPIHQKVIRHGGGTLENPMQYSNTYEWDGQNWNLIASDGPPGYCGLFFDSTRQSVMAYAALSSDSGWRGELWELHGSSWIKIENFSQIQEPAWGGCYGFDPISKNLVLFGGGGSTSLGYSKNFLEHRTLEWDGSKLHEIETRQSPGPRSGAEFVYDTRRGRFILFGGRDGNNDFVNDTWEYSTTTKRLAFMFSHNE